MLPPSGPDTGNAWFSALLDEIIEDTALAVNPLLACDLLLCRADETYASNVPGYSRDSASMEWDLLLSRPPGLDLVELSHRVVRAYLRKLGDSHLNKTTVWSQPSMAKEMNDRFAHLIRSDTTHPGRGKLVAAKFQELLNQAKFAAEHREIPSYRVSCVSISERQQQSTILLRPRQPPARSNGPLPMSL